jgi:hypothetical protein
VNTRHKVLNWFRLLRGVIATRPVLIYYAIEIDSSLFLSGSSGDLFWVSDDTSIFTRTRGALNIKDQAARSAHKEIGPNK